MSDPIALFDYDQSFDPSFPIIYLELGSPLTATTEFITALVDTGSDASLFPQETLDRLGAEVVNRVWIRGLFGERRAAKLYLVTVRVGPHQIYGIQAAGVSAAEDVLVGRDVLNQLVITLNGPGEALNVLAT